jgi:thiamine biosynthesis lipoprotein
MPDVSISAAPRMHRVLEVMGTVFVIDVRGGNVSEAVIDAVADWWRWVDETFSTYTLDSDISRLARGERRIDDCAPEVTEVLSLCAIAGRRTGGYFTACPDGHLDPSGLVKGWSIEVASRMLCSAGSAAHCLNGGGDVRVVGAPSADTPWHIGIAHPTSRATMDVVAGTDLAVATSGSAERGAHIVDPFTGRRSADPLSVSVVGPDLTWADVYATAAVAMGPYARSWLETIDGYEGRGLSQAGETWCTSGWHRHLP